MRQSIALFDLGQVTATRSVTEELDPKEIADLIRRHVTGDGGILCNDDIDANKEAIKKGERILSAYSVDGKKIYVITEWDRSYTSILFADEY